MPTEHILDLLVAERDRLNRAIEALQGSTKRRGRPPQSGASTVGRRVRTAAQNKAQSERMKAYWAKRRREEAKAAKS